MDRREADGTDRLVLSDLLDRLLDTGVVLSGDIRIALAEVDLLCVGLRLVVGPADTVLGLPPATREG